MVRRAKERKSVNDRGKKKKPRKKRNRVVLPPFLPSSSKGLQRKRGNEMEVEVG